MKLPALRFVQSGKILYLAKMTARQILNQCVTQEWDPDIGWANLDAQGYQRQPETKHWQAIAHFLANSPNPFMPTGALLSARISEQGIIEFSPLQGPGDTQFGELNIPDGRPLFIIDYQHRWRGLKHAVEETGAVHLQDFSVPVIIIEDVSRYEEMLQFYVINSKQKRIDTDLGLALLQTLAPQADEDELVNLVGPGNRFRIRATRLTFNLASRPSGPWAGRIAQPHDVPKGDTVIKVKSFVDSLQPVVSRRNPCSRLDDDSLLGTLVDFWEGIKQMIPAAFVRPKDYQIQRTVGVYAFHILFARHVYPRCSVIRDTSPTAVQNVLQPAAAKYIHDSFWSTKGPARIYVGSSGYRELAKLIAAEI